MEPKMVLRLGGRLRPDRNGAGQGLVSTFLKASIFERVGSFVMRVFFIACIFFISFAAFAQDGQRFKNNLRTAEELYDRARYGSSLSLLDGHTTDPDSLFLIGRDYYMLGEFEKATRYLKKAVNGAPENSQYSDWLGRTYRERATTSNPLSAVSLTKRERKTFERAVQLDPKNADALSDLFYYYLQTPAILGGDQKKAQLIAEKMSAIDPYQALSQAWQLVQKRNKYRVE